MLKGFWRHRHQFCLYCPPPDKRSSDFFSKLENCIFKQAVDMAAFLALFIILTPIKNTIRTIITSLAKKLLPTTKLRVKIISEVHTRKYNAIRRSCFAVYIVFQLSITLADPLFPSVLHTYFIIIFLLRKTNLKWEICFFFNDFRVYLTRMFFFSVFFHLP